MKSESQFIAIRLALFAAVALLFAGIMGFFVVKMRQRTPFVGSANVESGYRCRFTVRPDWKRLPAPSGQKGESGFEYVGFGAPPDPIQTWINKHLHRPASSPPSIRLSDGPLQPGMSWVDIVQGYPELPKGFNATVTRHRHLTIDGYHATQLTLAYGKSRTTGLLVYVPDHSLLFAVGSSTEDANFPLVDREMQAIIDSFHIEKVAVPSGKKP